MVLHYCCFNFLGPSNIAMQTQSEFLINYKWRHVQIQQSAQFVFNKKNVGTNTATCLVKINVNFSNVPCYTVLLILFQVNLRYLQITYRINVLRESSQTVLFPISLGHVGTLTASFETSIKIHLKCIKECFWEKF